MGEELRELIDRADDDYLIGLGNKGILKRAYKDLEQESPEAEWQQEETQPKIQVRLGGETCVICAPLGESTCTCPSRSMCRHIVAAILWLKGNPDGKAEETGKSEESGKAEGTGKSEETGKNRFPEFLEFPLERLVKACGAGRFRKFLAHVRAEGIPTVEASSIVTVELPWEQAVVKLLEPLSYSSCTCHSRELCAHKAQALLVWRLREGACTLQELETGQEAESALDLEQMREVCESLREAVKLQLCTGLSRQSPETSASMERMAVISHRAGLADMERSLRGAAAEYAQYFERQARFREDELLGRLLELYRLAGRIQREKNAGLLRKLAGTFRDTYEYAGKLRLIGMGSRSFQSKAGYEGEIYYFLNEADGRYLTWTDARPTFYEGTGRKPRGASENSQAPWGLNCSRQQLLGMEIELADARLAPGGRLSASQETKGELLGTKSLCDEEISQRIVWDYRELLEVFGAPGEHGPNDAVPDESGAYDAGAEDGTRERMALLGAIRWGQAVFDKIRQRFSWELFDTQERRIYVSLKYSKEEKLTIRLLERIEKRVREGGCASMVLFGSLYLAEGRLCLYPVEFWLQEEAGLLRACGRETGGDGKMAADGKADAGRARPLPAKETLDIMEQYLKEAKRQMADLFVSGLQSSSENLERRILVCSREGEELGLHYAGEKLARIAELLTGRHHQLEFSAEPLIETWGELQCYLKICGEKVSLDRARLSIEADEGKRAGRYK